MNVKAEYVQSVRDENDELIVSFKVDDDIRGSLQKEVPLMLSIEEYKKHRSLSANAYFWQLCDKIAKKLKSDKETIYLMKLKDAGVFETIDIIEEAIPKIEQFFRLIEIDYRYTVFGINADGEEEPRMMVSLRCYHGSHEYDSKQMSELIESTVNDAQDLGIETMTPDELEHMCSVWRAK